MPERTETYDSESPRTTDEVAGASCMEETGQVAAWEGVELEDQPPVPHVARDEVAVATLFCTRPLDTNCARCAAVCPHDAIDFDANGLPRIDRERCTDCGLCCGVCDAFGTARITLRDLATRVKRLGADGEPVYFTCSEHVLEGEPPAANVVVLPCLAALPPEFWCVTLREGVNATIHADFGFCDTCFAAGEQAEELFSAAIELGEAWSGRAMGSASVYPLEATFWDSLMSQDVSDRRGLLDKAAAEGLDIATGEHRRRNAAALTDFEIKRERMRAEGFLRQAYPVGAKMPFMTKRLRPRQELLAQSVREHPDGAEAIPRWVSTTDPAACTACGACVDACPTDARVLRSDEDGAKHIEVDAIRCIACGACLAVCEANACDYRQTSAAEYLG